MIARTRRFALAALTLTFAALAGPPARAQQAIPTPDAAANAARSQGAPGGPTVDRAVAGARALDQQSAFDDANAQAALQSRLGLGQARALMIVGFAAVVIGLLLNNDPGTLIAIVGAGVGLYGLYHYLK